MKIINEIKIDVIGRELEKEYFKLRINQESELNILKNKQSKQNQNFTKELKKLKGVSKKRIHQAITIFKKLKYKSIQEYTNETYDLILSNLERSFKRHYELNEKEIKKYISNIFIMQDEMSKFRSEKKKIFNEFKIKLKENNLDPSMLNYSYIEFKNTLKYLQKEEITIDEYNKRVSKYNYLNELSEQFLLIEYTKINERGILKNQEAQKKKQQEDEYIKAINSMFSENNPNKKTEEEYINSILQNMINEGELVFD